MASEAFFIVEVCKGNPDQIQSWWEDQRFHQFAFAQSYVKNLLGNRPDLVGQYRINRVQPLPLDFGG